MAQDKKSFLLYCDIIHTVLKLKDEQAGVLFKHILNYVNDNNPELNDLLLEIAFEPIKQSLKRDLKKYENTVSERSKTGKLGGIRSGEVRRLKKQTEANEANASILKQTEANEAVIDSVSDIVSVIDYLNSKTGKKFKSNTDKTKKIITARFNDGFTINDFKKVVDNKVKDWLNDEKMNEFLRPETLFGTKFESYLNKSTDNKPNKINDIKFSNGFI